MNLELIESFGENYPEDFDGMLDCVSIAITCAFNRWGALLAVGCNDGRIAFWDFLTRGVSKVLTAHIHPICSLSWSRNGQRLLSASTDNTVSIWQVLTSERLHTYRFSSPILHVQYNPRDEDRFLVCPMKHPAIVMNVDGSHQSIPLTDDSDLNIVASFDRKGKYIYTGNAKGQIMAFQFSDLSLVASFLVCTGSANMTQIKQIEFAPRSDYFLVNGADRVIRIYDSKEVLACGVNGQPQPMQKLQDLVNKTSWKACCFSGDGEYIAAGSARQHSIFIWEKSSGTPVKDLHGTKGEMLLDLAWHPARPVLCSISSGVVSVWSQRQVENWSAFAPDFKELDENVEYEERESEFDVEDDDKSPTPEKMQGVDEQVEVDVDTVEPIAAFVSSDEDEEDNLIYLPISPDIDDPEEQPWSAINSSADTSFSSPQGSQELSPRKRKFKTTDIELSNGQTELHPLLNTRRNSNSKRSSTQPIKSRNNRPKTKTKVKP